jgi:hypothetical protein
MGCRTKPAEVEKAFTEMEECTLDAAEYLVGVVVVELNAFFHQSVDHWSLHLVIPNSMIAGICPAKNHHGVRSMSPLHKNLVPTPSRR